MRKSILTLIIFIISFFSFSQKNQKYKIKHITTNENKVAFGATYFGNDFVIYSALTDGKAVRKKYNKKKSIKRTDLDFYFGILDEKGKIVSSQRLTKDINSFHDEVDLVFTNNLKTVYFTKNVSKDHSKKALELYKADVISSGFWSNIVKLPFNEKGVSFGHPCLSSDNKTLYFASDMEGSLGSTDIYKVAILGNNTYGKPKNLGNTINTSGEETTPFIEGNTLYFSSNGRKTGYGNLDIYATELGSSKVVNLGDQINSNKDDIAFTKNKKSNKGYFSSNRNDKDAYEIFYFEKTVIKKKSNKIIENPTKNNTSLSSLYSNHKKIATNNVITKKAITNDEEANALLNKRKEELIYNKKVNSTKVVTSSHSSTKVVKSNAYVPFSNNNFKRQKEKIIEGKTIKTDNNLNITNVVSKDSIINQENTIVHNNIGQQTSSTQNSQKTTITKSNDKNEYDQCQYLFDNLNSIYFGFDQYHITPQAADQLDRVIRIMKRCPNTMVIAEAHTDSRASYDYNLVLSEKRAASAIEYILKNGNFSSERIKGVGFGEVRPRNRCEDGVKCKESEHLVNRRTKFVIANF